MAEAKKTLQKIVDENAIEFIPFGATDRIKLSAAMIREFIAVPTKSGALPNPRDCVKFLMLCKGKRANPFEGDCFLIGYDSQNGPSFSMVCGIELFLKRAEQSEDYDGRESGVIVESGESGITERQGAVVFDNEKLLGGWAKVYRKNHGRTEYKAVKFSTYNTGRSRWEKDPGGQIEKVALSQALRQAYPTALGGLYTQEEMQRVTEAGDGVLTTREPIAMPEEITAEEQSQIESKAGKKVDSKKPEPPQHIPPLDKRDAQPEPPKKTNSNIISDAQIKRLFAIYKNSGITEEAMKGIVEKHGFSSRKEITKDKYGMICDEIEGKLPPVQDEELPF